MKKKLLVGLATSGLVMGFVSYAEAALFVHGTVDYSGAERKLIYDDDFNITWLDFSNGWSNGHDNGSGSLNEKSWATQVAWAEGLILTINGTAYDNWRLPATVDGPDVKGYDGTTTGGYNITTSEMGHLFYEEFGNKGAYDTLGHWQGGWYLSNNTGPFENLLEKTYYSGTEEASYPNNAWMFGMYGGSQESYREFYPHLGIAVYDGQIQATPTPVPATMLLFGSGFVGLVGTRLRRRR